MRGSNCLSLKEQAELALLEELENPTRAYIDPEECQQSLLAYTEATFPGFTVANHHKYIAEHLEAVERGEIKRLMLSCPPRHSKSELASRRFPSWFIGKHPNKQIITSCYATDLARDFGMDVRNIIYEEEYQKIFPNVQVRQDSKAAYRWHTNHNGVYIAAGVGRGITGRGADIFLIDDPHKDREDADSLRMRERVWNWYRSVARTRLMPNAAIIVIQTRWHQDDLSGRLLENSKEDWVVVKLPALAEENDPLGRKPGEALWPDWYNEEQLKATRDELSDDTGTNEWVALYQQSPRSLEGSFFKQKWIKFYDEVPEYIRIYGASDYAVSSGKGDWTVHLIVGVDPGGNIYVLDMWRKQADSAAWVEAWCDMVEKWQPTYWAEERGQIINGVGPFLERRMREREIWCHRSSQDTPSKFTSSSDKATRARAIQGRFSQGKVFFDPKNPDSDIQTNELLEFTGQGDEVDDIVDCFSLVGRMLNEMRSSIPPPPPEETEPADYRSKRLQLSEPKPAPAPIKVSSKGLLAGLRRSKK